MRRSRSAIRPDTRVVLVQGLGFRQGVNLPRIDFRQNVQVIYVRMFRYRFLSVIVTSSDIDHMVKMATIVLFRSVAGV